MVVPILILSNNVIMDGWTALMIAIQYQPDCVGQLIDGGANVNIANNNGWTALMYACRYDQTDTLSLILEAGALPIGKTNYDYDNVPKGSTVIDIYQIFVTQRIPTLETKCNSITDENHIQLDKITIANGSYGFVRSGTYQNQPVAIKYFFILENRIMYGIDNQSESDKIEEAIIKELTISVTINNPYIILCHGIVFDNFTPKALIMELGDSTLEKCIGKCALYNLMTYSWHYIQGIEYMHSLDILHRDIKPSNVIIVNHVAKISDFGESKQIAGSMNTPMKGTLMYIAPEVLSGEKYKYKADIYSIGVSLIQTITNIIPDRIDEEREAHLGIALERLRGSPALAQVLELSIHKKQDHRPGIDRIIDALDIFRNEHGI
eukprot:TRINITY_DN1764_c0_g1_i3.p1 TRINITY_DN1764_c0_g1~~TRINITY_DN1764_c0_g1_i3.p1  ORF type:complete len:378 (-),score=66.27 TRINITY_DN1764_c0_g1_i3:150-1283(-)